MQEKKTDFLKARDLYMEDQKLFCGTQVLIL